jgi:hypothetical protein
MKAETLMEWNHPDHHVRVRVWQSRENEFGWATPFEYGYAPSFDAACTEIETALFWRDEVTTEEQE